MLRSSSSRFGKVRKISLDGKGLCRNTPQLGVGIGRGGRGVSNGGVNSR
jgi:hypothetical protein